jgi:hypothetical protein
MYPRSLAAAPARPSHALADLPLNLIGHAAAGMSDGVGNFSVDLQLARPTDGSKDAAPDPGSLG